MVFKKRGPNPRKKGSLTEPQVSESEVSEFSIEQDCTGISDTNRDIHLSAVSKISSLGEIEKENEYESGYSCKSDSECDEITSGVSSIGWPSCENASKVRSVGRPKGSKIKKANKRLSDLQNLKKGKEITQKLFFENELTSSQQLMPPPVDNFQVTKKQKVSGVINVAAAPKNVAATPLNVAAGQENVAVVAQFTEDMSLAIQSEWMLDDALFDELRDPNACIVGNCIGTFVSCICATDVNKHTVAVHVDFSGNQYTMTDQLAATMVATDFLMNPLGIPMADVKILLIPIQLADSRNHPHIRMNTISTHYALAVFDTTSKLVRYYDPYGQSNPTELTTSIIHQAITTMPATFKHKYNSIVPMPSNSYNLQSRNDVISCGYYICFYAQQVVRSQLARNITVPNFSIDRFKAEVFQTLYNVKHPQEDIDIAELPPLIPQSQLTQASVVDIEMEGIRDEAEPQRVAAIETTSRVLKTPGKCMKEQHPGHFCAQEDVHNKIKYYDSGKFNHKCLHCKAFQLPNEFKQQSTLCCNKGKVDMMTDFETLQNPPQIIKDLSLHGNPDAQEFLSKSRRYNTEFAFGSVHTNYEPAPGHGIPVCRINGETSYELSDLFARPGKRPIFGQMYALEPQVGQTERQFHANENRLSKKVMLLLDHCIRENHAFASTYHWAAQLYKTAQEEAQEQGEFVPFFRLYLLTNREAKEYKVIDRSVHEHRTEVPTSNQVALVWVNDEGIPPDVNAIILQGADGETVKLLYLDPNVDPTCYPLLFPYGNQGYRFHIKLIQVEQKKRRGDDNAAYDDRDTMVQDFLDINVNDDENEFEDVQETGNTKKREFASARQYYRFIIQMRALKRGDDCRCFHFLWTKRTLAELFTITTNNKIESHEMEWVRRVQDETGYRKCLSGDLIKGIEKGLKEGETLGKVYMSPPTWKGSRRYMQQQYADMRAMSRELGNSTWFLTFTGNPKWPEITEHLMDGQLYTHRPDIVCRVFYDKVQELVKDIWERHVLGPCAAFSYSVEHQKRGMPHIHMLIILKTDQKEITADFVDTFICAEIPDLPNKDDQSAEAEEQRLLHKLVTQTNLHDCNALCLDQGKCNKRFPKTFTDVTLIHGNRYPEYKRRPPPSPGETRTEKHGNTHTIERKNVQIVLGNSQVVAYNKFLMLKYRAHHNLEHIATPQAEEYACKYIMKGHDLAYVRLESGNVVDYDEMAHNMKVRFMTSMEAIWRMYGYRIVFKSHLVIRQFVYCPDRIPVVFREGFELEAHEQISHGRLTNMLQAFFVLCQKDEFASTLTYDQVGKHFYYNKKAGVWRKRKQHKEEHIIVRLGCVSPANVELFALRLLLLKVQGPTSYNDLKIVDGVQAATFIEAAQLRKLLSSDAMWMSTLSDARNEKMGMRGLIRFFALMLVHCQPENPIALHAYMMELLFPSKDQFEEEPEQERYTEAQSRRVNNYLEYYLRAQHASCQQFGLPEPENFNYKEVEAEVEAGFQLRNLADDEDRPNVNTWENTYQRNYAQFNDDQKMVFDHVREAIDAEPDAIVQRQFFLQGAGGTGKTFVYNTIIAYVKSQKKQALVCASTGIAATLLTNGVTAHSAFRIPNDIAIDTPSNVQYEDYQADYLREQTIVIIDEVTMLHRFALEYIDRVLQSIQPTNQEKKPFGRKVVLIGGDFKQMLPVVIHGKGLDQIEACVKRSPLFAHFMKYHLCINMRVDASAADFAQFLDDVGTGKCILPGTTSIEIPVENMVTSMASLTDFCFPQFILDEPIKYHQIISKTAILAPTNYAVNYLNNLILQYLPTEKRVYDSIDTADLPGHEFNAMEGLRVHSSDKNVENLHQLTPNGFPPHRLELRVGAIVILVRNIDVRAGLCNGSRLQVMRLEENLIHCRLLNRPMQSNDDGPILLPRIQFKQGTSDHEKATPFMRTQFPIRLSFAMTINKAQGQTLECMGLALNKQQVFSHGQLYVALSRVRRPAAYRVLLKEVKPNEIIVDHTINNRLVNVVLPEALE